MGTSPQVGGASDRWSLTSVCWSWPCRKITAAAPAEQLTHPRAPEEEAAAPSAPSQGPSAAAAPPMPNKRRQVAAEPPPRPAARRPPLPPPQSGQKWRPEPTEYSSDDGEDGRCTQRRAQQQQQQQSTGGRISRRGMAVDPPELSRGLPPPTAGLKRSRSRWYRPGRVYSCSSLPPPLLLPLTLAFLPTHKTAGKCGH